MTSLVNVTAPDWKARRYGRTPAQTVHYEDRLVEMNAQEPDPTAPQPHNVGQERPDLANPHVREDVGRAGRCANLHLPTGRTCLLPERHPGACDFTGPGEAAEALQ